MLPALAFFLISAMVRFSCCSSLDRSRSSSRCAFCRERWCCRSRSAGVTVRPNKVSWLSVQAGASRREAGVAGSESKSN